MTGIINKISSEMFTHTASKNPEVMPVFVVGLPRSGTTLLYQLLLNHFQCSYFTRLSDYCYRSPVTAYRIQSLIFPQPQNFEYESQYGRMKDRSYISTIWRPVEGHRIWERWFPREPTHCYEGGLSIANRQEMQSTIAGVVQISGKPFVNKNPRNSLRVAGLLEVFPKAVVIVVKRNSLYVAQSLYVARIGRQSSGNGNYGWWGTKPKEFIDLRHLDPLPQAVGQTRAIEQELKRQLLNYASASIVVDYEDICEKPGEVLSKIQNGCEKKGIELQRTRDFRARPFPTGNKRKVSEAEFNSIQNLLSQF